MSVLIGHAASSETGGINGARGDSTGREVCVRDWYNKPWDFMAIHPDAGVRERHARAIEAACANNNIGYGQADRNTLYQLAKAAGFDLSKVGKCNCDCSSLQNVAAVASGAKVTYGSNGWTTWDMRAALQAAGYKIITDRVYLQNEKYCVRGAIYVNTSKHTVTGLSNGSLAAQTFAKVGIAVGNATNKKSNEEIAQEVINGKWGNGNDRQNRLKAAGYDPNAVQRIVNSKLSGNNQTANKKSVEELAKEVWAGKWGKGQDRINRLTAAGYDAKAVQQMVNKMYG